MERISFSLPEKIDRKKRVDSPRTEWDEIIGIIVEHLNRTLPREYTVNGKTKIAKKFSQKGLHFKLLKKKITLHRLKVIKATCEQAQNYSWTFNSMIK